MRAQRVRVAESRIERQPVKWTAEGAGKGVSRVFCDVGHTLVAGDMLVSRRAHGAIREPRWHRGEEGMYDPSLAESFILPGTGLFV